MRRNFRFNDSELWNLGRELVVVMNSCKVELESFGITQQKIDDFDQLVDNFMKVESGKSAKLDTSIVLEDKNEVKLSLIEQIKEMSIRFKLLWGGDSLEYKELGIKYINPRDEEKLQITAKNISKAIADNFVALQSVGLTQEIADNFNATLLSFENKVQEYSRAKLNQKKQTEIKIEKGNELYKLIKKYSEAGKTLFYKKSPSKYKNFLIFNSNMGTLEAPINISFDNAEKILKWDHVTRAISYRVEYSADGENFEKVKATKKEFLSLEKMDNINGFYRIKARNNQNYGPYSEVYKIG